MAEKLKITYATLSDSNEEIHKGYEAGLAEARGLLGASYGNFVDGTWITDGATFEKRSPIDGSLVGTFVTLQAARAAMEEAGVKRSQIGAVLTTRAPRSGVRLRMSSTVASTWASVTMPFSTSSSRRLTSISWK